MKRIRSALLAAVLCLSLAAPAFAAEGQTTPFNAPTQEEYVEAKAYLAAIQEHLDVVRAVVNGGAPKTEEEFYAKLREAQASIKAVWTMSAPAFKGMEQSVRRLRDRAEVVLWENIDPYLPVEENSGASPTGSGPKRLISWEPINNGDGSTVYRPNVEKTPAFDLDKFWNLFVREIIPLTGKNPKTYTYFWDLENECAESKNFLTEIAPTFAMESGYFNDEKDINHLEAATNLVRLRVMWGKDDGSSFHPQGSVTRGEAAKHVALIFRGGEDIVASADTPAPAFPDILGHWAESYINYCAEKGAAFAQENGNFDPNGLVNGLELLRMCLVALGYDAEAHKLKGDDWQTRVLELSRRTDGKKLTEGLENVTLTQPITREDMAQILYNTLDATPLVSGPNGAYTSAKHPDGTASTLLYESFGYASWDDAPALPILGKAEEPQFKPRQRVDPTTFSDAADITYWDAVATLAKLGVIDGKEDSSFDPAGNVTRAEAAKLISIIMLGGDEYDGGVSEKPAFSDIQGHWAEKYINYCADMHIINGAGNGTFDPDGQVSVLQMYKMTLTALGYDPEAYALVGSRWASMTLERAKNTSGKKLTEGLRNEGMDGTGTDQPASREVVAQILYNALQSTPITAVPDGRNADGTVVWKFQPAADRDNGQPMTWLYQRFAPDELPTIPAQPTV